jgi:transcriptional regulator with XRE-family HTH domain
MKDDPKTLVGIQVRNLRKRVGYSQEKLADCCGLDRTYIGGIERGERNVSLENIVKISKVLGVSPSRLLKTISIEKDPDG